MRIALDTNRYRDLVGGDPRIQEVVETADLVVVPFIVLAELRAGFAHSRRRSTNEQVLLRFLMIPGTAVRYPDNTTTTVYANVYAQLRNQGTPIPTNDLWIAALVIQHGLTLVTRDRHFTYLPQLARLALEEEPTA